MSSLPLPDDWGTGLILLVLTAVAVVVAVLLLAQDRGYLRQVFGRGVHSANHGLRTTHGHSSPRARNNPKPEESLRTSAPLVESAGATVHQEVDVEAADAVERIVGHLEVVLRRVLQDDSFTPDAKKRVTLYGDFARRFGAIEQQLRVVDQRTRNTTGVDRDFQNIRQRIERIASDHNTIGNRLDQLAQSTRRLDDLDERMLKQEGSRPWGEQLENLRRADEALGTKLDELASRVVGIEAKQSRARGPEPVHPLAALPEDDERRLRVEAFLRAIRQLRRSERFDHAFKTLSVEMGYSFCEAIGTPPVNDGQEDVKEICRWLADQGIRYSYLLPRKDEGFDPRVHEPYNNIPPEQCSGKTVSAVLCWGIQHDGGKGGVTPVTPAKVRLR